MTTAIPGQPKYQPLPSLSDAELLELESSIEADGLLEPVVVDEQGDILDGHHRARAWANLVERGLIEGECPTRTVTGLTDEEKRTYAFTTNVVRRQMSAAQKREQWAVRRENIAHRLLTDLSRSDRSIARELGASPDTVGEVRREVEASVNVDSPRRPHTHYDVDPLDHPIDVIGYDEYGTPLGWVEKETAEHLYTVQFVGRLIFKVPSDKTRMRGDKEGMPRESVESEAARTPISLTWTVAERDAGWEGLLRVANQIRQAIVSDPIIRRDWPRIPRHGERE